MRASMLISNSSKLSNVIQKMCYKFRIIKRKNAFIHWYIGSQMTEDDFTEAEEDLINLQRDYEEASFNNSEYLAE